MKIELAKDVLYIIETLRVHGHRADAVGGCVRDFLMGKEPFDIDITTSAKPEEMKAIFAGEKTIETGIKHGTLTLLLSGTPYEITTYRVDGEYADHRHPTEVIFSETLAEDLARRDFTVNAMCYSPSEGLTDLYGGRCDLENKIIRAVGEAERRFTEDALRILRGLRFSATLGFAIEEETAAAMKKCAHLLSFVSAERVLVEWKKLLGGREARRVLSEYKEVLSVTLPFLSEVAIDRLPDLEDLNAEERMLLLFALIPSSAHAASSSDISMPSCGREVAFAEQKTEGDREPSVTNDAESLAARFEEAALALRSDRAFIRRGTAVLAHLFDEDRGNEESLCLLLHHLGADGAKTVLRLRRVLASAEERGAAAMRLADLDRLIEKNPCVSLASLAVGGKELASIGLRGVAIGEALSYLLAEVMGGRVENESKALLAHLEKRK